MVDKNLIRSLGVTDEEVLMSKDVDIGERCWEQAKRIETWSAIPLNLIYRLEGSLDGVPRCPWGLKKEER